MSRPQRKRRFDPKAFAWAVLAALIFVGIVILYTHELDYFGVYLRPGRLFITALVIGSAVGLAIGMWLRKSGESPFDKYRLTATGVIIGWFLLPILLSLSNRWLSSGVIQQRPVKILEHTAMIEAPYGVLRGEKPKVSHYKTTFVYNGETFTLYPTSLSMNVTEGTTQELPFRCGFWGFDWLSGHE